MHPGDYIVLLLLNLTILTSTLSSHKNIYAAKYGIHSTFLFNKTEDHSWPAYNSQYRVFCFYNHCQYYFVKLNKTT